MDFTTEDTEFPPWSRRVWIGILTYLVTITPQGVRKFQPRARPWDRLGNWIPNS